MSIPTTIFERLIAPPDGSFSKEHAKFILSLKFTEEEQLHCQELGYKAQAGTLTTEEDFQLRSYISVNSFLIILKCKAREAMKLHAPDEVIEWPQRTIEGEH